MIGNPEVIAVMQRAVSAESQAEHQYIADAEWLDLIGLTGLAAFIAKRADEEKEHLTDFCRRLIFFSADPIIAPKPTQGHPNVTDMLRNELRLEMESVALYTEACQTCLAVGDFVTFDIVREILSDEDEHVRYIEGALYLIAQMGEANYLQGYIQLPEVK